MGVNPIHGRYKNLVNALFSTHSYISVAPLSLSLAICSPCPSLCVLSSLSHLFLYSNVGDETCLWVLHPIFPQVLISIAPLPTLMYLGYMCCQQ